MQNTIDLSAGLVPANNNSQPTQGIDLSSGLVPASQPQAQPQESGFIHTLKQALFLEPQDPNAIGNLHNPMPADATPEKLEQVVPQPGTIQKGIEKGGAETLSGTSQLLGKAADKLGLRDQSSQGTGILGEASPSDDELEANGTQEEIGKVMENVFEYMTGDEALKALTIPQKLEKMAAAAKFIEKNPWMGKMIRAGITNAGLSGAQTAIHEGDLNSDAVTSGLIGGATGGTLEGAGLGLKGIGNKLASRVANSTTAQAADEFGIPLSVGQKSGSPIAQTVETVLQKVPFINNFTKLGASQDAAIKSAADDIANSISAVKPGSVTQSGEALQNAISEAKNTAGKAYADAQSAISSAGAADLPVPLKGNISDTAQRMLDNIQLPDELSAGIKDVQGRQAAVDVLQNLAKDTGDDGTPRSMTWEQARRLKSQLFDLSNSGESNVGSGAIKQMTAAIDDSMQKALTDAGKSDLAQQFKQASTNYRAVSDAMDTSFIKRLASQDPIDVGKFLVNNASPTTLQTLKTLAPSQLPAVQRGVWEELFNRALSNPDGAVAGKVLQKEFNKTIGQETAQALWNPNQLQKINRFVDLVGKSGLTGGKNSIGSVAAMSAAGGAVGGEALANPSALKGILIHTSTGGGVWVGAKTLAHVMTKPNGPEMLINAFNKTGGVARSKALVALVNQMAIDHAADQQKNNNQ